MTQRMCCALSIRDGRKMICRRSYGHEGDHSWSTRHATRRRRPLELVAYASELIQPLPEGDYTHTVAKVYINGRTVMIQFDTNDVEVLKERRRRGVQ